MLIGKHAVFHSVNVDSNSTDCNKVYLLIKQVEGGGGRRKRIV